MKDQHRNKQPGTRSADRQDSGVKRGGRQSGGHDSSHQPGTTRTAGSAGQQNREDPRSPSFITLDKDDIF